MKIISPKTIKAKVLIVFLSITLFSFITVGIIVGKYSSNILLKNTEDKLLLQSLLTTEQIDKFLSKRGTLVEQMQTNQDIIEFMNSVQGRDTVRTDSNYKSVISSLKAIKQTDSNISSVWIALEKPNYIVIDDEWDCPTTWNIHERPWYSSTTENKGIVYTEPYKDAVTGKMVISIIKSVYDQNNKYLGV